MQAVWVYPIIFIILFFPISLISEMIISNEKSYFCFSVFAIPLVGGCVKIDEHSVIVNLANKKNIEINLSVLLKKRGSISKFKGIILYSFKSCLITGMEGNSCFIIPCFFIFFRETLSPVLLCKMPYLKLNNNIALVGGVENRYVVQFKFWINIFYLLLLAVRIVIEKVEIWKKKSKAMPKNL